MFMHFFFPSSEKKLNSRKLNYCMHRKATEKLWLNLTVANKLGQIYPIFVKCRIKDTQAPRYRSCSSAHELTGSHPEHTQHACVSHN